MTELTEKEILEYMFLVYFGNLENKLSAAIKRAYRDFNRTLHGFGKNEQNEEIRKNCHLYLEQKITSFLKDSSLSQEKFDNIHKEVCDRIKEIYGNFNITYGQTQKWINMTLKYYLLLDKEATTDAKKYFHIPIDNNIIGKVKQYDPPKITMPWSKLDDYNEYFKFQVWFRNNINGIPIIKEFRIWNK